jgi:hypothetical protein
MSSTFSGCPRNIGSHSSFQAERDSPVRSHLQANMVSQGQLKQAEFLRIPALIPKLKIYVLTLVS